MLVSLRIVIVNVKKYFLRPEKKVAYLFFTIKGSVTRETACSVPLIPYRESLINFPRF
jgi:hypothetical protein